MQRYFVYAAIAHFTLYCLAFAAEPAVREAVATSTIRGGLCVVLGDLSADQAAELARSGSYLVHVLSPADVTQARAALNAAGLSGTVIVDSWREEELPYMDGLVSQLVVLDAGRVSSEEQWRVVRPEGERLTLEGESWRRELRPRPSDHDDWGQWRHGADRNPVSRDRAVDVPRRVQWLFSSAVALEAADMVTAQGRVFIQDRDRLLARDAFNGLPLWEAELFPAAKLDLAKLGIAKPPALLAARGNRVYALSRQGKFQALDAATGQPCLEFAEAGLPTAVLLLDDDTLITASDDRLAAFNATTARLLWRQAARTPRVVVAGGGNVFYIEGSDREGNAPATIMAREVATGAEVWRQQHEWAARTELASYGVGRIVYEVRRPLGWRELWAADPNREKADRFQLAVIDAQTGAEQQRLFGVASSARHGEFCTAFWKDGELITEARTPKGLGLARYAPANLDKPLSVFQANFVGDRGWGHCYPPVLTERFYINGQLHFTNLESQTQAGNVITRGACHILRPGYIPANGMIYTFPKHCVCFPMLNGNVCLAPQGSPAPDESHPLEKGPAFGTPAAELRPANTEWPTFRHNAYRTAGTAAAAPRQLTTLWSATPPLPDYRVGRATEWAGNPYLAGPLSAPVVAAGKVFVAQGDAHALRAYDAATGAALWTFFAGGRIDGPPSLQGELALFGCRDGWLYAVRASDGVLAWRLRIAPNERRITAYGQLESAWPCAGSVLLAHNLAYVSAGLHPNADGGVRVACVVPATGELRWLRTFDDLGFDSPWPAPHDPRPRDNPAYVSDPWRTIRPQEYRHFDLPVCDGDRIAVSRCTFDAQTGEVELRKTSGYYTVLPSRAHLPRTAWKYNDVQMQAPLAASREHSVFSTSPRKGLLFRADVAADGTFNTDWVNVPFEQWKAGISHAASKIYEEGSRWTKETGGEGASYPRALLVAGEALLYAYPDGSLALYHVHDGRELLRTKIEPLAWDGAAATPGRLFVATASGKLLCLGAP